VISLALNGHLQRRLLYLQQPFFIDDLRAFVTVRLPAQAEVRLFCVPLAAA
jgi:hypothetical protein